MLLSKYFVVEITEKLEFVTDIKEVFRLNIQILVQMLICFLISVCADIRDGVVISL